MTFHVFEVWVVKDMVEVFLHCCEERVTWMIIIFKVNEVSNPSVEYSILLKKDSVMDRKLVYANKFSIM